MSELDKAVKEYMDGRLARMDKDELILLLIQERGRPLTPEREAELIEEFRKYTDPVVKKVPPL